MRRRGTRYVGVMRYQTVYWLGAARAASPFLLCVAFLDHPEP